VCIFLEFVRAVSASMRRYCALVDKVIVFLRNIWQQRGGASKV
jgi:hypothetical protein